MRLPHRLALLSLLAAPIALLPLIAACSVDGAVGPAPGAGASAGGTSPDDGSDPCGSSGGVLWVTVRSAHPAGGDVTAFADCVDGGAIPPLESSGFCQLFPSTAYADPAELTGTNIAHGPVRVTQSSTGLDVTVATREVRASFTELLAAGDDVRVEVLGGGSIHPEVLALPVADRVTVSTEGLATRAPRSRDLAIVFRGGTRSDFVTLRLATAARDEIRCSVLAEQGTIPVPSALLSRLPAGPAELRVASTRRPTAGPPGHIGSVVVAAVNGARTLELE